MPQEAPPISVHPPTESQIAFRDARAEIKELVKRALKEERQVVHMQKRNEIHVAILEAVKSVIQ